MQTFLEEVAETPDLVVLFDARGRSVWSSKEVPLGRGGEGGDTAVLRLGLGRALRGMRGEEGYGGEAMELG